MAEFQRDPIRPFADIQPALDELEAHLASAGHLPPVGRVRLLSQIGTLYRTSPEPARAVAYFEEAVSICRARNLRADEAINTLRLAVAYQYAGRVEDAVGAFKAALVLCVQRRTHVDFAYQHWAKFLIEQGETSLAVPYLEQALMQRLARGDAALAASTRAALEAARGQLTDGR